MLLAANGTGCRVAAAVQIKSLFFWKALVSETLVAMSPNC